MSGKPEKEMEKKHTQDFVWYPLTHFYNQNNRRKIVEKSLNMNKRKIVNISGQIK